MSDLQEITERSCYCVEMFTSWKSRALGVVRQMYSLFVVEMGMGLTVVKPVNPKLFPISEIATRYSCFLFLKALDTSKASVGVGINLKSSQILDRM
jgi:hypothetical protein